MVFCIDSMVFIDGIKKNTTADAVARAEYFLDWVDQAGHQLIIPTVVIAEVLAPEPLEKYPVYMDVIEKGFMVADFDTRAATRYSQLMMNRIPEIKQIAQQHGIIRNKMKIDHQIIACALVHNANCIYSSDPGLKAFGSPFIDIKDLPPLPPKLYANTLFEDLIL
jgi:predicted nucleic acid-binding protein